MRTACQDMIYEVAKHDPRVVYIGSDMLGGPLDRMKEEFPDRYFMEGISEATVIGMAAGLALKGYIPFVFAVGAFITRRCYEQIAMDLCLHNVPVRILGTGGGLVYAGLGPTHQPMEDFAILRPLPNMTVIAPADAEEMRRLIPTTLDHPGPVYIRLAAGGDPVVTRPEDGFVIGRAITLREPGDVVIISTGIMTSEALTAAECLANEGIACGVVHMHTIKPLDEAMVLALVERCRVVATLEEHSWIGGLGSAVTDFLVGRSAVSLGRIVRLAAPPLFTDDYDHQHPLLERYGLRGPQVARKVREALSRVGEAA